LLPECLRVVFGETQSSTLIRVVCLFLRESARWAVAHECVVELEQIAEAITKSAEPESVVWAALQRQNAGKEFLQALLKLKLAASHDQLARRILKNLPPSKPFALLPFAGAGIKRLEGNELMTVLNEARNKLFLVNRAQDRSHPEHAEQYVRALAAVDPAITLGRIEELFQRLDPFPNPETLQDYYCFPALVLVDRVLSTVITEDFEISDLAQAWLEQDEEQIRRRIRQDCARFLAESP
jgi:hypothetical protein